MYRSYEDPYRLQIQLAALQVEYEKETDEDLRESLAETIEYLKQRINFAWQDDEYDELYED